jgi:hypothetical protein
MRFRTGQALASYCAKARYIAQVFRASFSYYAMLLQK